MWNIEETVQWLEPVWALVRMHFHNRCTRMHFHNHWHSALYLTIHSCRSVGEEINRCGSPGVPNSFHLQAGWPYVRIWARRRDILCVLGASGPRKSGKGARWRWERGRILFSIFIFFFSLLSIWECFSTSSLLLLCRVSSNDQALTRPISSSVEFKADQMHLGRPYPPKGLARLAASLSSLGLKCWNGSEPMTAVCQATRLSASKLPW